MGINIGGFVAPIVTGFLAQSALFKAQLSAWGFDPALSWHWGFGAAGVGMTIGLIVFALQGARLSHVGGRPDRPAPRGSRASSSSPARSPPWR